jgi:hypothetical protein
MHGDKAWSAAAKKKNPHIRVQVTIEVAHSLSCECKPCVLGWIDVHLHSTWLAL